MSAGLHEVAAGLAKQAVDIGAADTHAEGVEMVIGCLPAIEGMPWDSDAADVLRGAMRLAVLRRAGMGDDPTMTVREALARLAARRRRRAIASMPQSKRHLALVNKDGQP